jgi:two-component system OmpR family sensor kinase
MSARRGGTSLATRITTLTLAVAGVAVVVAGLVAAGLLRSSAREIVRESLANQADVVASQVDENRLGSRIGMAKVVDVVRGQGISVVVRRPGGEPLSGDPLAVRAAVQSGLETLGPGAAVSSRQTVAGQALLVEMRGVGTGGNAFALVQSVRTSEDTGRRFVRNLLFALGVGLLVAAVAGAVLGRLLARPLRRTAGVAAGMRHGRRDLRVPVEGPAEVAEVATAVNELADALHHSESRQREFLLSVSHELRTPLTAVNGFAESLADGVVTGEETRRAGQTIQREAQRLERLVTDLLELARLGADEFRLDFADVDLVGTVQGCADVWRVRCEREDVVFRVELPPSPVLCRTDPRRLRQVLDGLAENALRVTPAGAPVVLSLAVSPAGPAVLQVRDGGPGLAEEDYPVAFQRGVLNARYRGRRPVGSGVGLALAHGLVTRMGGTMEAGPAPEGGAAFTVVLPVLGDGRTRLA